MQSRHIRDVVAPMRIIANFHDELAWMRFLMLWPGIGEITASKIISEIISTHSLDECLYKLIELNIPSEISETLVAICNLQYNVAKAIREALDVMEKRLAEIYKEDNWDKCKEDFPLLQEVAVGIGSISEFVAEYVLDPKLETTIKSSGKKEDHAILSTIHSAKGLEAKNVYILNVSPFSFPTSRAILNGDEAIEEERRCLYVAMTRAKDRLFMYRDIHSVHINREDDELYFLNNIPKELVNTFLLNLSKDYYEAE